MEMQAYMAEIIILINIFKLVQMKTSWSMGSKPLGPRFYIGCIITILKYVITGTKNGNAMVFDMIFSYELEILVILVIQCR